MGLFGAAHGWGGGGVKMFPFSKICHTYPTVMKLDTAIPCLKKIEIYINHVTHPLRSADISIFHRKSAIFVISGNTGIDCILMHNF